MRTFAPLLASALAAAVLAAGCAPTLVGGPAPVAVTLPPDAVQGAGDPLRTAITGTSTVFAGPARLAGRPALAARSIADMEFIVATLPTDPRFTGQTAALTPEFSGARAEWRAAAGIAPDAPPQAVVNALYAAARALDAGAGPAAVAAALPVALFPAGGAATLARLGALPALPRTNFVAASALDILQRSDSGAVGRR